MVFLPLVEARTEIRRISNSVDTKLILLGGLAISQYVKTRTSQTIHLVCDPQTAENLVCKLYPCTEWEVHHLDNSALQVKHKHRPFPSVKFVYNFNPENRYETFDEKDLNEDSVAFSEANARHENIRVPSQEALCYTKLVSFLTRPKDDTNNLRKDLCDILELTNLADFRFGVFFKLISKNMAGILHDPLFQDRLREVGQSLEQTNLVQLLRLFSLPNTESANARREKKIVCGIGQSRSRTYDYSNVFSKATKEAVIIGLNNSNLISLPDFYSVLERLILKGVTVKILMAPPLINKQIGEKQFNDLKASAAELKKIVTKVREKSKELKRNNLNHLLVIKFNTAAASLSAIARDIEDKENGLIVLTVKWATDNEPNNRIYCVLPSGEHDEAYGKITGPIGEMFSTTNSLTLGMAMRQIKEIEGSNKKA